jgi:hypothetical protein
MNTHDLLLNIGRVYRLLKRKPDGVTKARMARLVKGDFMPYVEALKLLGVTVTVAKDGYAIAGAVSPKKVTKKPAAKKVIAPSA